MQIIRTGVTRTVILTRRYAIKVPSLRGVHPGGLRGRFASFAHGLLDNQAEHVWHDYQPWIGKVAPVLSSWLGGLVQVYPRCEPIEDGDPLPQLDPYPGDDKPANFGRLRGRVVWIDYPLT